MRCLSLSALLLLASSGLAQQVLPEPQLNPDATVTLRYAAPGATRVTVAVEGMKVPLPMQKDASGLWVLTTPVLKPEYYSYHFNVDGTTQLDARNPAVKASYLAVGNSLLVPGTPAEPWEVTAVPHGVVHHHTFTTKVVTGLEGAQDEFYVYTPPGYDAHSATKYPVLYLLHGWSDTAAGWTSIGHANDILDNLIAAGKAKPMVVVMPLGYGEMTFLRHGFGVWNKRAEIDSNVSLFTQSLMTEVLPQVERMYNVSTKSSDRAIAGLSMGGLESLTIGLTNPDKFAWVGGFSSAVHMIDPDALPVAAHPAPLKLLWIACGTSDDLIQPNRSLIGALKAEGMSPVAVETPGMHTWLVWRDNLVHFAPLLFQ